MKFAKIFFSIIFLSFFNLNLFAQESASVADSAKVQQQKSKMTMERAQILVPRPSLSPVKSMIPGEADTPGDTVQTTDPKIMVVLYPDGTWKYAKDPEKAKNNDVFEDYWSTDSVWPYNIPLSELPYVITLVLSDDASGFCCPYRVKITSPYGRRWGRNHNGVDLGMPHSTKIYAAFDGKVRLSSYHKGFGNIVIIRHESGLETWYAHLSERKVRPGQWVKAGDVIGLCGSTGRSTGPHLHFETRYMGYSFDPQWIIDFEKGVLRHGIYTLRRSQFGTANKYIPQSETEEDELYKTVEEIMEAEQKKAEEQKAKAEAAKAAKSSQVWYTVKKGDSLSKIASKHGTTVSKICKLNKGMTPKTTLKVGRKIRVK